MGYGNNSNEIIQIDNKQLEDEVSANTNKIGLLSDLKTTDKSSLVNATNENTSQLAELATSIMSGGAKGDWDESTHTGTDDTDAIQNVLGLSVTLNKAFYIPNDKKFRITKPLKIPAGVSFFGFGVASKIVADYSAWQGTDYRAIIIESNEGINYGYNTYNRNIGNFILEGYGNNGVVSQGIDFSTSTAITKAEAVNYAFIFGCVHNILIGKFDTALNLTECWNSHFDFVEVVDCRRGLNISGKVVNVSFGGGCKFTNFNNSYTSDTTDTLGINIQSKTYTDGEGRPEGLSFAPGFLCYGAKTNLKIISGLKIDFQNCILDGATTYCVDITGPSEFTINNSYIYTSGANYAPIILRAVGSSTYQKIDILNNKLVGASATGQVGIEFENGGVPRAGLTIDNNTINSVGIGIEFNLSIPNYSRITNNYGESNTGSFIHGLQNGKETIIDGNSSADSYPILELNPNVDKSLVIGKNFSPTTSTYFSGYVTLPTGATTVNLPNNFFSGTDYYYRAITKVIPEGNVGNFWVANFTGWTTATFNCTSAPAANVKIYYEAMAIPYSATQ